MRSGERFTVSRYFAVVNQGVLAPDERVGLLEGLIVASPQAVGTSRICHHVVRRRAAKVDQRSRRAIYREPDPERRTLSSAFYVTRPAADIPRGMSQMVALDEDTAAS